MINFLDITDLSAAIDTLMEHKQTVSINAALRSSMVMPAEPSRIDLAAQWTDYETRLATYHSTLSGFDASDSTNLPIIAATESDIKNAIPPNVWVKVGERYIGYCDCCSITDAILYINDELLSPPCSVNAMHDIQPH